MYWALDKVVIKEVGKVAKVAQVSSTGEKYLALESKYFGNYKIKELRVLYLCYLAKFRRDGNVSMLGSPTVQVVLIGFNVTNNLKRIGCKAQSHKRLL